MPSAGAKHMGNGGIVLLLLTAVAWVLLAEVLKTVVGVYAPGDQDIFLGLRWILAYALICGLWLCLGGLLLMASEQPAMPRWVGLAALVLDPASAAAALAGLYLVQGSATRWMLAIPLVVPPLIAAYVFSLYQPALRATIAGPVGTAAVWASVLFLSVAVWPALSRRLNEESEQAVKREQVQAAWNDRERERKHDESLAKLQAMTPDRHLTDWYSLLDPQNGVRDQALAALRKVPRRQADVEEGLNYGIPAIMRLVPELDLTPTPKLCEAGRTYLRITADGLRLKDREPYPYTAMDYLDWTCDGVRWFEANGCNCDKGVTAIETAIRTYSDSVDRQKVLASLAGLKQRLGAR